MKSQTFGSSGQPCRLSEIAELWLALLYLKMAHENDKLPMKSLLSVIVQIEPNSSLLKGVPPACVGRASGVVAS